MPIQKEQWDGIENELKSLFATVEFKFNERKITVQKQQIKENKFGLLVFIDGKISLKDMEWKGEQADPLVRQFWRKREKSLFSPSKVAEMTKRMGKKAKAEFISKGGWDKKIIHYDPVFNTASSLVRQFKKIEGLELAEEQK